MADVQGLKHNAFDFLVVKGKKYAGKHAWTYFIPSFSTRSKQFSQ